jgi:hypothetical protein
LLFTILLFVGFCYSVVILSDTFSSDKLVKETDGKVKAGATVENMT